jgi:hypothetical protein
MEIILFCLREDYYYLSEECEITESSRGGCGIVVFVKRGKEERRMIVKRRKEEAEVEVEVKGHIGYNLF